MITAGSTHIADPLLAGVIGFGRRSLSSENARIPFDISATDESRVLFRPRARYDVSDGKRAAARIPMIAMTIMSSTSVNQRGVIFIDEIINK